MASTTTSAKPKGKAAPKAAPKKAAVHEHKPTIKWVDAIIARRKASGATVAEQKAQRDALIKKHGITV